MSFTVMDSRKGVTTLARVTNRAIHKLHTLSNIKSEASEGNTIIL